MKHEKKKEKIVGYGNKSIMDAVVKSKFLFNVFKTSTFMVNKKIQLLNSLFIGTILCIFYKR